MGIGVKALALPILAAVLAASSVPATAQTPELFAGFVMSRVCLPYASRAKTFENAVRAARDMEFRRPVGSAPLDDWASEVELVSKDGRWRLRLQEGTEAEGDVEYYSVTCGVSSTQASTRELGDVARLLLRNNPLWSQRDETPWRWDRRTRQPTETAIRLDVTEARGQRPVLAARGSYY